MSQRIRLRYSTIVNYVSMMYKVAASLAFTVVVARRLDVESFGVWGIIMSLAAVLLSPISLWGFWVQRHQARGRLEAGATGFALTLLYSLAVVVLFAVAGIGSESLFGVNDAIYFLAAAPLAAFFCITNYLNLLSRVVKPELIGYVNLIYDTLRVPLAYYLLAYARMGLMGVIFAVEASQALSIVYMLYSLRGVALLGIRPSWRLAREWLKAPYVPTLNMLITGLRGGFRAYLASLTGSPLPVAYYNVTFAVETPLLKASNAATPALYARMLRGGGKVDFEESLSIILLFTGFIVASLLAAPRGVLALFGHDYVDAALLLQLVTIYAALQSLVPVFSNALLGVEDVDKDRMPGLRRLAASLLVKVPAVRLAMLLAVYALLLPIASYLSDSPLLPVEALAVLLIATRIPLIAYYLREMKKRFPISFPRDPVLPIAVASTVAAAAYVLTGADTAYSKMFWLQLSYLVPRAVAALAVYASTLFALSPWFRKLLRDALHYIASRRA